MDIYLEPVLPPSRFLVFGVSPVARALSRVAAAMGLAVDAADPAAERAMFPEAERVWTNEPWARDRAAVRRRRDDGRARRGGSPGGAGGRARVRRRRRQREAVRADPRHARGAGHASRGVRPGQESGRPRHRGADARGDRGEHPGRDRPGAARRRGADRVGGVAAGRGRAGGEGPRLRDGGGRRGRRHTAEAAAGHGILCSGCREKFSRRRGGLRGHRPDETGDPVAAG